MGLLNDFGFDELASSLKELTDGIEELKADIVESVIGPGKELKDTAHDIAGSIKGYGKPSSPASDAPASSNDTPQ